MQPPAHQRPMRLIWEFDHDQVAQLVTKVFHALTPRVSQPPASRPRATEQAEEQPEEEPQSPSGSDPPPLPQTMRRKYYLGSVCLRGHTYEDLPFTLRLKSTRTCCRCAALKKQAALTNSHKPPGPLPAAGRPTASEPTHGTRPELPPHLAETCFLSPLLCEISSHRYRNSAFTLRFLDDEDCTQCVTQMRNLKAGD